VLEAVIVGGGPAGLMAAEVLAQDGISVHLYDAMPTVGRKFLLAGIGGLNLTHAEDFESFVSRFGARSELCRNWLTRFGPQDLRNWASGLGIETFVGSSQRVFPLDMKAAPLLRAWLHRLRLQGAGVQFHMRHRWTGECCFREGLWELVFDSPTGLVITRAKAVLFALGGGSWARLGSNGRWTSALSVLGAQISPLKPANCGFEVMVHGQPGWSDFLASRHAGQPLKNVSLSFMDSLGGNFSRRGEFVLTQTGVEGSLVYAASAVLRDEIERHGSATFELDLKPDWKLEKVEAELSKPRHGKSLSNWLKSRLGLSASAIALMHELLDRALLDDPRRLAARIKCLALTLHRVRPIDEAISSAGGVELESLTDELMIRNSPGLFCAGEMLDWEVPTGGYLLTACMASGRVAGLGALAYLRQTAGT
jgi:uncharacterized flavoprotein (TIGR03862 family)